MRARRPAYRITGSLGFSAAARTVFIVVKDATDPNRRIMAPLKNNIAPDTDGFAYSVQSVTLPKGIETSQVVFEDAVHRATADEVLIERSDGGEALKEAKDFLEAMLAQRPMEVSKLQAAAKDAASRRRPCGGQRMRLASRATRNVTGGTGIFPAPCPPSQPRMRRKTLLRALSLGQLDHLGGLGHLDHLDRLDGPRS